MLENLFGHTWCNCLECDQRVEALRVLIVGRANRDDDLIITLFHFSHSAGTDEPARLNTIYRVFGEQYYLLHPSGDIQDPQLVDLDEDEDDDWDEDEDEDDDDL